MEQGSKEWLLERAGKLSASRFKDLLKPGAVRQSYLLDILAQRLDVEGAVEPTPMTPAMSHGLAYEQAARDRYWVETGQAVELHPGRTARGYATVWGSPDGLVSPDGMIEIKCPTSRTHLKTILAGEAPPEYLPQMQGLLWIYERRWCDFVSYDPRNKVRPLFIKRIDRDDAFIERIEAAINDAESELFDMELEIRGA